MMNGMFNQNNNFNDSMQNCVNMMHESSNHLMETGKKFFNHQMNAAQNNIKNAVESAQHMMYSKNPEDLMKAQKNFVASSVNHAMQNGQELGHMMNESATQMYNMVNKTQTKQEAAAKK